jgi:chromosome segregation ATPase
MRYNEALEEVKRMLHAFRAFEQAQHIMELLANAEQVQGELAKANEGAAAEFNKVKSKIADAQAEIDAAKAEAKDIQSEALKKATDVEAKANAYAAKVAADSKAEFEKTQVLLVKMRNECDAEAGKIAKAKEELASIEKKLADVKAKMQALFS